VSTVDVIVPCYRYAQYLRQCVQSVLSQRGVDVRVLIIDDASPDHTPEVGRQLADDDARVAYTRHLSNRGHIATYNEGLSWASADYLLLLSADDYLLEGALERAVELMNQHPEVGFTFGNAIAQDGSGVMRSIGIPVSLADAEHPRVLAGVSFMRTTGARNIVPTPTAVVRTELQKVVGGYRKELPHTGDMEMWLRLAARASVGVVGANQAVYRQHTANMSGSYKWLQDLQQREAALHSFLDDCEHLLDDKRAIRRQLFQQLGREAVGAASWAFNDDKMELSDELLAYARLVDPSVRRSWPWAKLAAKRLIGRDGWHALQSSFRGGRSTGSHAQGPLS
jgi:Glycosyl transferase family 2